MRESSVGRRCGENCSRENVSGLGRKRYRFAHELGCARHGIDKGDDPSRHRSSKDVLRYLASAFEDVGANLVLR